MFHLLLLLLSALSALCSDPVYCQQKKEVPSDVVSSFQDSTPNLKTGTSRSTQAR